MGEDFLTRYISVHNNSFISIYCVQPDLNSRTKEWGFDIQ